ncbi:facilitated trehalose transporter Tret1-2 homolog [Schistocerca cancellata]|uniref:facilitated trehalose transporter Tret1-2 homolog n=1 Tax=Schistocerca cancellata TaxID=274614 RepID=UPI0021177434|nr:facilitated trehalose transporter Tret1-2 homolog [Schistocerca cancellata]
MALVFAGLYNLCGSSAMTANATQIFLWSGSSLDSDVSTIILSSIQLASSLAGSLVVDRLGRRPVLLTSYLAATISVAVEGVYFYLREHADQDVIEPLGWLPLTALVCFFVTYNMGAHALTWTVVNEIVPTSIRGLANSAVAVLTAVVTFAIMKLFQIVSSALGTYVPFWFFGACAFAEFIFTFFLIPETKGRTLEDISAEMRGKTAGGTETDGRTSVLGGNP